MRPSPIRSFLATFAPWWALTLVACGSGERASPTAAKDAAMPFDPSGQVDDEGDEGQGCTGLIDCGVACEDASSPRSCVADNFLEVFSCDHCPRRADSHVCESGSCRRLETNPGGSIQVFVVLSSGLASAQSLAIAAILPSSPDGSTLTCAKLLQEGFVNNAKLNVVNSRTQALIADATLATPVAILTEPGTNQLALLTLTDGPFGAGRALARGCKEGIEVRAGQKTTVDVPLTLL